MAEKNSLKLARMPRLKTNNGLYGASSETQGQSVGSREKARRKALPESGPPAFSCMTEVYKGYIPKFLIAIRERTLIKECEKTSRFMNGLLECILKDGGAFFSR